MWTTVLFDLDGTLTDSGEGITRCVQYALRKEFGIEVRDPAELRSFVGPPLKEQFMRYASLTEEEGERAVAAYRERYSGIGIYENRIYDGIRELLTRLSIERMTLAVASSKPEGFVRQVLRYFGIEQYFRVIVGSEMDGTRSRKVEVIEECLRRLGMERQRDRVVLVGDRSYDIAGAAEAGIGSIGVTYGYGTREELEELRPDCIVDTPEELKNVLYWQFEEGKRQGGEQKRKDRGVRLNVPEDYRALNWEAGSGRPGLRGRILPWDGPVWFRIWRICYPVLLQFGLSVLVTLFIQELLFILRGDAYFPGNAVILTGAADAVLLPVCLAIMHRDEQVRTLYGARSRLLRPLKMRVTDVFCIILFTMGVNGILDLLVAALPISDPFYDSLAESLNESAPAVLLLVVVIIGPIMEEVLFRGILYRRLRDYLGVGWAAVLSGVIFGAVHGNWIQGVYASLFGILLALLYEHYGTLWASLIAHFANNAAASFALLPAKLHPAVMFLLSAALAAAFGILIFRKSRRVNVI